MIAVVDACSGNLRSVQRALEQAGGDVVITADPEVVRGADKIVVPGQGAFGEFAKGIAGGLGRTPAPCWATAGECPARFAGGSSPLRTGGL